MVDVKNKDLTQMSDGDLLVYKKQLEYDATKYNNFQQTKKVQLNSAYGAMGNPYFRFYDIRLAEAVTLSGQLVIRWVERDLNKYFGNLLQTKGVDYVIAMDTDSVYLTLEGLLKKVYGDSRPDDGKVVEFVDRVCKDKIDKVIEESCIRFRSFLNAYAQKMKMKRESIGNKAIWTAKKRYMINVMDNEGIRYEKAKIKLQGIEAVKSSTPEVCRKRIKEVIELIMTKDEKTVLDYIETFKTEFFGFRPEDIAFPRSVNGLETYGDNQNIFKSGTPIHARGSLFFNHLLVEKKLQKKYKRIKEGDKIKYLYLKEPNPLHDKVISFPELLPPEFDLHKYIDYEVQFEKTFLDPLKHILEAIGWKHERKATLEDFLS